MSKVQMFSLFEWTILTTTIVILSYEIRSQERRIFVYVKVNLGNTGWNNFNCFLSFLGKNFFFFFQINKI